MKDLKSNAMVAIEKQNKEDLANATTQKERWRVYDSLLVGCRRWMTMGKGVGKAVLEAILANATTQEERWRVFCLQFSFKSIKKAAGEAILANATTQEERWKLYNRI